MSPPNPYRCPILDSLTEDHAVWAIRLQCAILETAQRITAVLETVRFNAAVLGIRQEIAVLAIPRSNISVNHLIF